MTASAALEMGTASAIIAGVGAGIGGVWATGAAIKDRMRNAMRQMRTRGGHRQPRSDRRAGGRARARRGRGTHPPHRAGAKRQHRRLRRELPTPRGHHPDATRGRPGARRQGRAGAGDRGGPHGTCRRAKQSAETSASTKTRACKGGATRQILSVEMALADPGRTRPRRETARSRRGRDEAGRRTPSTGAPGQKSDEEPQAYNLEPQPARHGDTATMSHSAGGERKR